MPEVCLIVKDSTTSFNEAVNEKLAEGFMCPELYEGSKAVQIFSDSFGRIFYGMLLVRDEDDLPQSEELGPLSQKYFGPKKISKPRYADKGKDCGVVMEHWDVRKCKMVKDEKVDEFIEEVIEVCKKHKLSISHEDQHGAFEITTYDEHNSSWLRAANI